MCKHKHNPHAVSPKAMQSLSIADREGVVFCQQAYVPLDGALMSAIGKAERSMNVRSSNTRG